jgi:hypothetical protein
MHKPRSVRRRTSAALWGAGMSVGLVATALTVAASPASSAVPSFPDNLLVFPDRDFVSVEGFPDHAGETATLEVTRPGSGVIGSAKAVVSGTDVAFEVNHPGGVCWGAGGGLDVTPDIRPGDVVSISFPDNTSFDTTTSSASVVRDMTQNGQTITVNGFLGADVTQAQLEQRIINPDLVDLIGRRDVRAVPGPMTPAPKGGYSSSLTFPTATSFVATYQFSTLAAANATAAADLGERAMSWQNEDAAGNRQGLTIAEFGEVGGPGMGGCPAGPGNQPAPVGSATITRSADKTNALVKWGAVTAVPGAEAITGYNIEALGVANAAGRQDVIGARMPAAATSTTITGLNPAVDYTFEVRSMAGQKLSLPFDSSGVADTTLPTLALSPDPGDGTTPVETDTVTANSNGQVFFTTDGSSPVLGDVPSDTATLYTGPIPITGLTDLSVAAFDAAGNVATASGTFKPAPAVLPSAPTGLAAGTATQNTVPLTWNAGPASVTGYQVTVYNANGVKVATQPAPVTTARQAVAGLRANTTYQFSVAATSAVGTGVTSAKITKATTPVPDRVTVTSARWKVNDLRIVGTGSVAGATIQAYRVNADGTIGEAIPGGAATVGALDPTTGVGAYSIQVLSGVPTNPGQYFLKSTGGATIGPRNIFAG